MADLILMPKLGFDMSEGTLITWVKNEGETVEKGELIAEIETDKATVEVEAMYSGTVRKHLVAEGAIVPVNNPIAVVGKPDEEYDLDALIANSGGEPVAEQEAEVTQPAAEVEPVPAPSLEPTVVSTPQPAAESGNGSQPDRVVASPLARRIASDNKVDLGVVTGSGPGGRIVKEDVEAFLAAPRAAPMDKEATKPSPSGINLPAIDQGKMGPPPSDIQIEMTRLRKAIGRRMSQSNLEFPSFFVTHEYNMGTIINIRKSANHLLESSGEKLSVNDFIVKAAAMALREFPNLNASLQGEGVVHHGSINIGVAVAVPNGLLTVVTQDADRKTLRQISKEVKEKAARARSGKVRSDDVTGSTFSISNLGMFNVAHFVAIINPPEAAILALGSASQVPVVEEGDLKVGWRMNATISVDHRVSDGAEAAKYMQALGRYLENPLSMML